MVRPDVRLVLFSREFPALSQTFLVLRFKLLAERGWDVSVLCENSPATGREAFPDIAHLYDRVHVVGSHEEMRRLLLSRPPGLLHFEFGHHALDHLDAVPPHPWLLLVGFQGYDICIKGLDREPGYYDPLWARADAFNFTSADVLDAARARGLPPDAGTAVTPPLADLDLFDPGRRQHLGSAGTAERPLRVLYAGRIHWKKGLGYGLRAMSLLAGRGIQGRLRIAGDGPSRPEIIGAARTLGIEDSVSFLGSLAPRALVDQFRWADVVLVPSVSEGFCLVALEAQAMMVPVVASDAEGLSENVSHGETGFVVPKRDPHALAERLAELALSPSTRQRMGEAGRKRVMDVFAPTKLIGRFEELYKRIPEGRLD